MGLIDGLVVLAIFAAFGYIILLQIRRKNPELSDRINEFFSLKILEKASLKNLNDPDYKKEQIWREKVDRM